MDQNTDTRNSSFRHRFAESVGKISKRLLRLYFLPIDAAANVRPFENKPCFSGSDYTGILPAVERPERETAKTLFRNRRLYSSVIASFVPHIGISRPQCVQYCTHCFPTPAYNFELMLG
jgi:hypothetical protein